MAELLPLEELDSDFYPESPATLLFYTNYPDDGLGLAGQNPMPHSEQLTLSGGDSDPKRTSPSFATRRASGRQTAAFTWGFINRQSCC